MSTTLTNGLKLPDKGSVDWYADMQNNYNILDGAVGTIAEHSTQISGKAPLVHMHTKADITDFPAYGNTAGTICEGNDSRLSDARTPVAHTHGKSDVTDLLNSNFIPSSNGSYNLGSLANRWGIVYGIESNVRSDKIDFTDTTTTGTKAHWHLSNAEKNGSTFFQIGSQRNHSAGLNEEHFRIKNANDKWADLYIQLDDSNQFSIGTTTHSDVTNNGFKGKFTPFDSFIPYANNSYDLGSSGKQWNNLYAKSYYYNGTAWGLDKANAWSANQKIANSPSYLYLKNTSMIKGTTPTSNLYSGVVFQDSNNSELGSIVYMKHKNSNNLLMLAAKNTDGTNDYECSIRLNVTPTGAASLYPDLMDCSLGIVSRSWTNLWVNNINSINPGILSLPDLTSNGYIELSDNISANTEYSYTPPADGWLALYVLTTGFHVENAVGIFNGSSSGNAHRLACSATSGINLARSNYYHGAVILPVITGIPYLCWIKIDSSTTLASKILYFYKAAGNV